jgi:class 3 adenylate cyclase
MQRHYNTLEDFLISNELSVDAVADDGWGASFPVKGREIQATVLFSDISGFSKRTLDLSPTETLIFVNNFFAWITAEAVRKRPGIVDKYIGDEIMIVFSKEFGSEDPFGDAVQTARQMCGNDALAFDPHIGIASGPVIVGYVGTAIKYNCSVFGPSVALAARCAAVKPEEDQRGGNRMVFPSSEWGNRNFGELFPPRRYAQPNGRTTELPTPWEISAARSVEMKNIGQIEVREIRRTTSWVPFEYSAEQKAKETLQAIRQEGRYWPREE